MSRMEESKSSSSGETMTDPEAYEKYCSWCEYIGIVPAEHETWKKTTSVIMDAVKQSPNRFGKVTVLRQV